jgi:glycosyltransferase involved in cell wall biosynthesis
VDVACPDARQPAYRAVAALARTGVLGRFHTAYYHNGARWPEGWLRGVAPKRAERLGALLRRRFDQEIPVARVNSHPFVDLMSAAENRCASPGLRRLLAVRRTEQFDRVLAHSIESNPPDSLLLFSDVGSVHTISTCKRLGIPVCLSVVHGDPDEEVEILEREANRSPDFYSLYLGDGRLDLEEIRWLHARRKREAEQADLLLVPSEHIAARLVQRGIACDRIRVIPYAADLARFHSAPKTENRSGCTFVFAGALTQRKGIKYLIEAWSKVYRPGWSLWLVGAPPRRLGPLAEMLQRPGIQVLGPMSHSDVPKRLASADVFVFPSLFEGSAVVTYEAMACGLPSIVTANAGSVARDGIEGLIVPAAEVEPLAHAMEQLGGDPELRHRYGQAARRLAETFSWHRYGQAVVEATETARVS